MYNKKKNQHDREIKIKRLSRIKFRIHEVTDKEEFTH